VSIRLEKLILTLLTQNFGPRASWKNQEKTPSGGITGIHRVISHVGGESGRVGGGDGDRTGRYSGARPGISWGFTSEDRISHIIPLSKCVSAEHFFLKKSEFMYRMKTLID
jgi:hypothetical protein